MSSISLFSGVGGLEPSGEPAEVLCELDFECHTVLARRFPEARIHDDVMTLPRQTADAVFGGWPCQDLSVAGLRKGLEGDRSGLFFRMVDIAVEAGARVIVAENVPNLLRLDDGENFRLVLEALHAAGFEHVAWRTLNARQFGLPHQRRRVFLVASAKAEEAWALLRPVPTPKGRVRIDEPEVAGFYWTAGLQGITFSEGYSPTLKVGSSLSIPSPPAVLFEDNVRMLTHREAIRLQGFPLAPFRGLERKAVYRMMGNAVALPVGTFVAVSINQANHVTSMPEALRPVPREVGLFEDLPAPIKWPTAGYSCPSQDFRFDDPVEKSTLCTTLEQVVDREDTSSLSHRAASGLLSRLDRSGKSCPEDLRFALERIVSATERV